MARRSDCPPNSGSDRQTVTVGPELDDVARLWGTGWKRNLFPGFWLVYLGQPISAVAKYQHALPGQIAGYSIIAVFAIGYLVALPLGWHGGGPLFWWLYAGEFGLTGAETFFAHGDALVFCVYLGVLTVATRLRLAPAIIVGLVIATTVAPRFLPGSHKFDWTGGFSVFLVSIAMMGFFKIIQSNIALAAARAEVARLAAENERSRIARDLHDLLGHSLTTITIKAGLARRLAERGEAGRARQEITEVEQLSLLTLGDVRAAVAGHSDVTLAGELATSREVLRAAGIQSELPGSVDVVGPLYAELFGWVLREGITNVVRHSRADHATVSFGPNWIEVYDDGVGGALGAGNGLSGLRERVSAVGGTLTVKGGLVGWRLRVDMPDPLADSARVEVSTG